MLDKLKNLINSIRFKTTKQLKGTLSAELVFEDGTVVKAMQKKNLITLTAKQNLLQMIYLSGQTSDPVNKLWIGTGGCIDPQGMYPKAINQTLTSLYTPLLNVPTSFTLTPSVPSVTFLATIDQGTGNGQNITEAALYTAGGTMFNILTFPAIPKTSQFSINFSWEIELA